MRQVQRPLTGGVLSLLMILLQLMEQLPVVALKYWPLGQATEQIRRVVLHVYGLTQVQVLLLVEGALVVLRTRLQFNWHFEIEALKL